jgi:hypothetical protein
VRSGIFNEWLAGGHELYELDADAPSPIRVRVEPASTNRLLDRPFQQSAAAEGGFLSGTA